MLEDDGFVSHKVLLHCAVYALVRRGIVVYVGQSKTMYKRIYQHCMTRRKSQTLNAMYGPSIHKGMAFDDIWIRPCMLGELDRLEVEMIRKYQPKYNVRMKEIPPQLDISELLKAIVPIRENGPPVEAPIRRRV